MRLTPLSGRAYRCYRLLIAFHGRSIISFKGLGPCSVYARSEEIAKGKRISSDSKFQLLAKRTATTLAARERFASIVGAYKAHKTRVPSLGVAGYIHMYTFQRYFRSLCTLFRPLMLAQPFRHTLRCFPPFAACNSSHLSIPFRYEAPRLKRNSVGQAALKFPLRRFLATLLPRKAN